MLIDSVVFLFTQLTVKKKKYLKFEYKKILLLTSLPWEYLESIHI